MFSDSGNSLFSITVTTGTTYTNYISGKTSSVRVDESGEYTIYWVMNSWDGAATSVGNINIDYVYISKVS